MDQSVAKTILAQLGGNRFIAMTGASSFSSGPNVLTFRLPARMAKNKVSAVRITLDPSDTYTVEFLKMVKYECVTVSKHENIYFDMLQELFTRETGLYTSL